MTNNLPDRVTLARVIRDGQLTGTPPDVTAQWILDHLRATSPPPTPGDAVARETALRERIEALAYGWATGALPLTDVPGHLRAALDATGQPETGDDRG